MFLRLSQKLQVSNGNTTVVEPYTGRGLYQLKNDVGLFKAMGGAGSSFGIVTEFLYKIYAKPETLPTIAMVFLENPSYIRLLEKAAMDGRYHVSWYIVYAFRDMPITFRYSDYINWVSRKILSINLPVNF